jgi:hypothetical protein
MSKSHLTRFSVPLHLKPQIQADVSTFGIRNLNQEEARQIFDVLKAAELAAAEAGMCPEMK